MRVHDGALVLREAGHEVYTPGLPGIGERTHLTSPQVDLTTHVRTHSCLATGTR
ncbi:hypothetical protein [Streptomyces mirabilis]|uniref:hypothetical protein n=1 Tax=Streptomyces mirabilis TaxID=68239 RepID=UPI0033F8DDC5